MKRRIIFYLIYFASVVVAAFVFIPVCIMFTDSRETGMSYGAIAGYCFIQLIFPYFYLYKKVLISTIAGIISILASFSITSATVLLATKFTKLDETSNGLDIFLMATVLVLPLIIFELANHFSVKTKKI